VSDADRCGVSSNGNRSESAGYRDYVQAAEDLGYAHALVFDHVLGADARRYAGWNGPYSHLDMFHEPFVLFGYLASFTQQLELVTGVIILGQRQTALVAKQAARSTSSPVAALARRRYWLERGGIRGAGDQFS
jgi:alkanesulfonate monooxygenase SsuD/methylene tetrahydromethanopterin reductase-like flavin-dependent oxidoreductase (luciferase family)